MSTPDKVKNIIADQLGLSESEVKTESKLVEDLGCDSLDLVEIVMAVEEEFEVNLPDEEAEAIKTVQNAIDLVEAKQKAGSTAP